MPSTFMGIPRLIPAGGGGDIVKVAYFAGRPLRRQSLHTRRRNKMRSVRQHDARASQAREAASHGPQRTRPGVAGESPAWERVWNRILATAALAMFAAIKLSQTGDTSSDADRSAIAPTYAKAEGCRRSDDIGGDTSDAFRSSRAATP